MKTQVKDRAELDRLLADPGIALGDLDVSQVRNFRGLFMQDALSRRLGKKPRPDLQDTARWDLSSALDCAFMFAGCKGFKADLSGWVLPRCHDVTGMFQGTAMQESDLPQICRKGKRIFAGSGPLAAFGTLPYREIPVQALPDELPKLRDLALYMRERWPQCKYRIDLYANRRDCENLRPMHVIEQDGALTLSADPLWKLQQKKAQGSRIYASFNDWTADREAHLPLKLEIQEQSRGMAR